MVTIRDSEFPPALRMRSAVEVAHDVMADLNATARERVLAEAVHEVEEDAEDRIEEAENDSQYKSDRADEAERALEDETKRADDAEADAEAVQRRLDEADEFLEEAEALFVRSHDAGVGEWLAQFRRWRTERAAATE